MSRYAFLFPGQGSQTRGMGQSLAEAFPESRAVFEAADAALARPISELCFAGSDQQLALTENTQPSILTVSVAALRALEARGLAPVAAAGHSLGEYGAHVAAGTFVFEEAVRAVQLRGRYMQEAVPVGQGAMAAILGLGRDAVERLCEESAQGEVVRPANLNGPMQIVIAGHAGAVERAVAAAPEAGARKAVMLAVSAPFHCSLMQPAADRLEPVLQALQFKDSRLPVFTNVDAAPASTGDSARDALLRQVASPVRWQDLVESMLGEGIETFVEVGPGKVLAGLMRGIRRGVRVLPAGDAESVEAAAVELGA